MLVLRRDRNEYKAWASKINTFDVLLERMGELETL
jgi:hypothetical protein